MKTEPQRLTCGEIILQATSSYDLLYSCKFCEKESHYIFEFIRHMVEHLNVNKKDADALVSELGEINSAELKSAVPDDELYNMEPDYYEEICIEVDLEKQSSQTVVEESVLKREINEDDYLEYDCDDFESVLFDDDNTDEGDNVGRINDRGETGAETTEEAKVNSLKWKKKTKSKISETSYKIKENLFNVDEAQETTSSEASLNMETVDDEVDEAISNDVKKKRAPKKFVDLEAITNPKRGKGPRVREVKSNVDRKYKQKIVNGKKMLTCDFCDALFSNASNLKVHHYRHLGIKPHPCTYCDKSFATSTDLKTHTFFHTGERPFVCEDCGLKYRDSAHLKDHRRRHANDRPHPCDVCGKRFYDKNRLREHAVCHTNDRPFECDVCGSTFQRRKALVQHEKLHLNKKEYECKICGKAFAQNAGLYSHMKHHANQKKI